MRTEALHGKLPSWASVSGFALVQGVLIWALLDAAGARRWPAEGPQGLMAAGLLLLGVSVTLVVLWQHRQQSFLWVSAFALGSYAGLMGYLSVPEGPVLPSQDRYVDDAYIQPAFVLCAVLGWLLILPRLRLRLERGQWRVAYDALFQTTWRSYVVLAEAVLFTGLFWLLLATCAALFKTLGIDGFADVFAAAWFRYPATTVAFAIATQLVGSNDRFIDAVLDQLLGLVKWLAPVAGLIAAVFVAALLPRLPELLTSGSRIISSAWLLCLVAFNVLLLNAAFRDGRVPSGLGRHLEQALRVVPALLLIVAATAAYSMLVRTQHQGLTPLRYWGLAVAAVALLYAAGYLWASLRPGEWMAGLRQVNAVMGLVLLGILLASLTPWGDPLRWSVASQAARALDPALLATRPAALAFLRDQAGERGRSVLRKIAPEALSSETQAAAVDDSPYGRWRARLRVMPAGRELPEGLDAALRALPVVILEESGPIAPLLVMADLDADGRTDALLWLPQARDGVVSGRSLWFQHVDKAWQLRP